MKTSDRIFEVLKAHGVEVVFLVPGGGAMHLVDSLGRSGIRYVPCYHEQGAGFAALGYAQATGKLGVCLVTSGPGATNAVTPCAAAWTDSVPVLFISGQTTSKSLSEFPNGPRSKGQQEVNSVVIVGAIVKLGAEPMNGKTAVDCLDFMIGKCQSDRPGPCWLSIPLDVQAEDV